MVNQKIFRHVYLSVSMRVLAGGTFNILHPGHVFFLTEAKKLGDELIVVVASDSTVLKKRGVLIVAADDRRLMVESLKLVDKAVVGSDNDFFKIVEIEQPDVIALGSDQAHSETELKKELKARGLNVKIVRIKKRLKPYSTGDIMETIKGTAGKGPTTIS
jgi:FAD synthetase